MVMRSPPAAGREKKGQVKNNLTKDKLPPKTLNVLDEPCACATQGQIYSLHH